MTRQVVLVPGDWPTTNQALDLARAAGWYSGRRAAEGWRRGDRAPRTLAAEAKTRRMVVAAYAKAARLVPVAEPVTVTVVLRARSGRPDPDAWTWAGKVALDGLTDAGVVPSDLRDVWSVAGRVVPSAEEWQRVLGRLGLPAAGPGLVVVLRPARAHAHAEELAREVAP